MSASPVLRLALPAMSNSALQALSSSLSPKSVEADEGTAGKIKVVGRYRTRWFSPGENYCVSPPLSSGDEEFADFPSTPAPPPSLMPIPDEASYNGPPQATAPSLIPVYHRCRTEWIHQGDPVAFTPGFNLEQFNAPVYVRPPENAPSWAQASAWALAQKSSEAPKKE